MGDPDGVGVARDLEVLDSFLMVHGLFSDAFLKETPLFGTCSAQDLSHRIRQGLIGKEEMMSFDNFDQLMATFEEKSIEFPPPLAQKAKTERTVRLTSWPREFSASSPRFRREHTETPPRELARV